MSEDRGEQFETRQQQLDGGVAGGWRARWMALRRGPLALTLVGAALIGLLAALYLHEVASVSVANAQLQALQTEHSRLERQDALALAQLGVETSPAYIDQHARAQGLEPGPAPVVVVAKPAPTPGGSGSQR